MNSHPLPILDDVRQEYKSRNDPNSLLQKVQEQIVEQAKRETSSHYTYSGSLLNLVVELLNDKNFDIQKINYKMLRDEFLDDPAHSLGNKGIWLRRRFYDGPKDPEYSLKYYVQQRSPFGVTYSEIQGQESFQEKLGCEDLDSTYPRIVASYNCCRISNEVDGYSSYIDIAYILPKLRLCYLIAFVVSSPKSASWTDPRSTEVSACPTKQVASKTTEAFPIQTQSKVLEALFHQNNKYFQQLCELGMIGPHNELKESSQIINHINCPQSFQVLFDEYDRKFYIPFEELEAFASSLPCKNDESEDEEQLCLPIQKLSDSD